MVNRFCTFGGLLLYLCQCTNCKNAAIVPLRGGGISRAIRCKSVISVALRERFAVTEMTIQRQQPSNLPVNSAGNLQIMQNLRIICIISRFKCLIRFCGYGLIKQPVVQELRQILTADFRCYIDEVGGCCVTIFELVVVGTYDLEEQCITYL